MPSKPIVEEYSAKVVSRRLRLAAATIASLQEKHVESSNHLLYELKQFLSGTPRLPNNAAVFDSEVTRRVMQGRRARASASSPKPNEPDKAWVSQMVELRAGNCGEKAEYCYWALSLLLPTEGAYPDDMVSGICRPYDHACLILFSGAGGQGPMPGLEKATLTDFGANAVVVDGWQEDWYAPNIDWSAYVGHMSVDGNFWSFHTQLHVRNKVKSSPFWVTKRFSLIGKHAASAPGSTGIPAR